jgi:hypothetical protein
VGQKLVQGPSLTTFPSYDWGDLPFSPYSSIVGSRPPESIDMSAAVRLTGSLSQP